MKKYLKSIIWATAAVASLWITSCETLPTEPQQVEDIFTRRYVMLPKLQSSSFSVNYRATDDNEIGYVTDFGEETALGNVTTTYAAENDLVIRFTVDREAAEEYNAQFAEERPDQFYTLLEHAKVPDVVIPRGEYVSSTPLTVQYDLTEFFDEEVTRLFLPLKASCDDPSVTFASEEQSDVMLTYSSNLQKNNVGFPSGLDQQSSYVDVTCSLSTPAEVTDGLEQLALETKPRFENPVAGSDVTITFEIDPDDNNSQLSYQGVEKVTENVSLANEGKMTFKRGETESEDDLTLIFDDQMQQFNTPGKEYYIPVKITNIEGGRGVGISSSNATCYLRVRANVGVVLESTVNDVPDGTEIPRSGWSVWTHQNRWAFAPDWDSGTPWSSVSNLNPYYGQGGDNILVCATDSGITYFQKIDLGREYNLSGIALGLVRASSGLYTPHARKLSVHVSTTSSDDDSFTNLGIIGSSGFDGLNDNIQLPEPSSNTQYVKFRAPVKARYVIIGVLYGRGNVNVNANDGIHFYQQQ